MVIRYRNSHDNKYVGELFLRYSYRIYGVCLKYLQSVEDAQDASMQIFEKLILDLKKHQVNNFKSWLHTVAKNHCLMQLRGKSKERIVEISDTEIVENVEGVHLKDEEITKAMVIDYLRSGIRDLKEEQRTCIEMFYLQERSYKEIALITDFNVNDVKSHIQNGKRNLKLYIERKQNEERKQQGKLF